MDLEEEGRYDIFVSNVEKVVQHNSDPRKLYVREINRYSAMTFEEVKDYYHMDDVLKAMQNCSATASKKLEKEDVPDTWDWREHGAVSPVKDQDGCGSCWAFSTVGCLESAHLIKYGSLVTYSEQQLVDCAGDFENNGCSGGLPSHAYEYIYHVGGLALNESYPYDGNDHNCTVNESDYAVAVSSGSVNITSGDEEELKEHVYKYGPTSACYQVVDDFSSYQSGIYSSSTCGNGEQDVNHAVLAVGYGTENGTDYWLCKNSWGADWGDHGYFKIQRGVNMCGMAMCNSHPDDITSLILDSTSIS